MKIKTEHCRSCDSFNRINRTTGTRLQKYWMLPLLLEGAKRYCKERAVNITHPKHIKISHR